MGADDGKGNTSDTTLTGNANVTNGFLARFDDDGTVRLHRLSAEA